MFERPEVLARLFADAGRPHFLLIGVIIILLAPIRFDIQLLVLLVMVLADSLLLARRTRTVRPLVLPLVESLSPEALNLLLVQARSAKRFPPTDPVAALTSALRALALKLVSDCSQGHSAGCQHRPVLPNPVPDSWPIPLKEAVGGL